MRPSERLLKWNKSLKEGFASLALALSNLIIMHGQPDADEKQQS